MSVTDTTTIPESEPAARTPFRGRSDADPPQPHEEPIGHRGRRWRWVLQNAPFVALVLGTKAMILAFGTIVAETIGERVFAQPGERWSMWAIWDAPHYLGLADRGYQTTGDAANHIVFFPGYPSVVHVANWVIPGDTLTAAFVVSGLASIAAALLLAALVRTDTGGDEAQSLRAVWFLLIFPTAYFLHIPYTESLFLALILGSFLAARRGNWAVAGMVGGLAAITRINGMLLLPALAVEAYLQYRRTGRIDRGWLWIAAVGVGTLIYLAINQHYFGDPLHFQSVQKANWYKEIANPLTSISGMIEGMGGYKPGDRHMLVRQELLFLAIGLGASVLAWFRLRKSYAVWAFLNVLLFASTSWIQSTPRYAITIFPIFLLLAQIKRATWFGMLISFWSLATLAWFTTMFALGRWAF